MLSIPPLHSSALEAACPFALHQLAGYFAFVRGILTPLFAWMFPVVTVLCQPLDRAL